MNLLLDENLSPRLVSRLKDIYPHATHVRDVGLVSASDEMIWQFAKEHDFVIVSKDDDFRQRSFLYGYPPKVIWIRLGNCPTSEIFRILRNHFPRIQHFVNDKESSFLILG